VKTNRPGDEVTIVPADGDALILHMQRYARPTRSLPGPYDASGPVGNRA
jgi:hypothetical protein